ncbi:DUF397 domain-containing protein [Streptomyces sp. NPDC059578]|uniref:DUF397 domain-containing protein n=1 Tax=Streptomyces sp. NPDC059578 TaxID=3346874 RepID=UPI003694919A
MSDRLTWIRSTYSDGSGSNCVEVALDWFKSTYSDGSGSETCVEVASNLHTVHLRDSKLGDDSPTFQVEAASWGLFIATMRM